MLAFVQQFLGVPDVVHAVGGTFPNGVESEVGMLFGWSDGRFASEAIGFSVAWPWTPDDRGYPGVGGR